MTSQAWRTPYDKKRRDLKSPSEQDSDALSADPSGLRRFPRPSEITAYVGRVRFDVTDFSNRKSRSFIESRNEMEAILISKKIPRAKREMAVIQTLNIAANHCLEP